MYKKVMKKMIVKEDLSNVVLVDKKIYVCPECQYIRIETEGMLCASGQDFFGNSDRFGGRFGR